MRDRRFVAEHRGGPLKKEQHYLLMKWACDCAEHVLPLYGERADSRLTDALAVAKAWTNGNASVGDCRKAAVASHAVARESSNPASIAVARAVGHAVATAHMADHSLGPAWYALKAVKAASRLKQKEVERKQEGVNRHLQSIGQLQAMVEAERGWQDEHLPPEIRELVLTARKKRKI